MATTFDELDDLVSAKETASQTSGKYLAIDVPDYEDAVKSASSDKRSYLRLGAADPDWTGEPGADLIAMAYLSGATGRESAKDGGYDPLAEASNVVTALSTAFPDLTPEEVGDVFIDDQRRRGVGNERADGAPGHGFTEDERRAISAKLHTDVGWRDHTDGNRISTTRGDKVEVVYGNYKLVVLGRQANPELAQGWEANGNHVQDFADGTMPGASVTVEWVPDTTYGSGDAEGGSDDRAKGAWLLQNSTERVYQYSRNAGNFRTQNWGDLYETYTGSENPQGLGTSDDAGLQGHPTFRDEALGNTISSAPTASSVGLPRGNPTIIERTWATKIDSQRGSESLGVPEIVEKTYADHINDYTRAGTVVTGIVAKSLVDYETAALILETRTGMVCTLFQGPRLVLELAMSFQITGLFKLEWTIGKRVAISNTTNEMTAHKTEMATIDLKIAGVASSVTATNTTIDNTKQELTGAIKTEVDNLKTEINKSFTKIAGTSTEVAGVRTLTAAMILLN